MEKQAALNIIQQLANGVDPHSGEVFRADSPYQHPDTVRALFIAVRALEEQPAPRQRAAGSENAPQNAGKPWSGDEDKALAALNILKNSQKGLWLGLNRGENAALAAVKILNLNGGYGEKLRNFRKTQADKVRKDDKEVRGRGKKK